jgi:predicted permease
VLLDVATVIAPLFICVAIGFAWTRTGAKFDAQSMGNLVGNLALPCLVFSTMTKFEISLATFGHLAGIYVLVVAGMAVVGIGLARAMGLDIRVYGPPMVFSNCGNMGLPVCLFAFGEPGLGVAVSIFLTNAILNYTFGTATFAGVVSHKAVTQNVLVYATVVALGLVYFGIPLPRWAANTAGLLGGISVPFMIVALGASIARLQVSDLPRTAILVVGRQLSQFALGYGAATLFGLEGMERGVLILMCSMPVAVVNYLFALRHDRSPEKVASMVVASTVVSYCMLPFSLLVVLPDQ